MCTNRKSLSTKPLFLAQRKTIPLNLSETLISYENNASKLHMITMIIPRFVNLSSCIYGPKQMFFTQCHFGL